MATRARTRSLTLDEIAAAARRLSPRDRLRLIERLAADLEPSVPAEVPTEPASDTGELEDPMPSRQSLRGLWKGTVPEISAEEITDMRREAWKSFPREHFFTDER